MNPNNKSPSLPIHPKNPNSRSLPSHPDPPSPKTKIPNINITHILIHNIITIRPTKFPSGPLPFYFLPMPEKPIPNSPNSLQDYSQIPFPNFSLSAHFHIFKYSIQYVSADFTRNPEIFLGISFRASYTPIRSNTIGQNYPILIA